MNTPTVMRIRPRIDPPMEAMLVTAENLVDVARWSGGKVIGVGIDRPEVQLRDDRDADYVDWAEPGQYVVRGVTGRYWAAEAWLFERDYEVLS